MKTGTHILLGLAIPPPPQICEANVRCLAEAEGGEGGEGWGRGQPAVATAVMKGSAQADGIANAAGCTRGARPPVNFSAPS